MDQKQTVTPVKIEYQGRLFGDVLRELIYMLGEDTYSFVRLSGITNVMLSNLINHKKYPGLKTLRTVAAFFPEPQQNDFVLYYKNPDTKNWSKKILREKGVSQPYAYSSLSKEALVNYYQESEREKLERLQI